MTLNADHLSRRLSWRGILAGLVMGVVTTLTIVALGAVITALTGLTLTGVGIAAAIWTWSANGRCSAARSSTAPPSCTRPRPRGCSAWR